jgi:hypothetical protein
VTNLSHKKANHFVERNASLVGQRRERLAGKLEQKTKTNFFCYDSFLFVVF